MKQYLLTKGHQFYTQTDTEVILHLYEELGPECLERLNGQFAFAIWNTYDKTLFLARDRVGIRPLHYTVFEGTLVFGSEIKSIFAYDMNIPRQLDPIALNQIFTLWTTLPGKSVFQNISELPPGHYIQVSNGEIGIHRYWDIPHFPQPEKLNWPEERIIEEIQEHLYDAIRLRLRADVPVGAYLSGGLDSSGIATMIKRHFNNNLKTFGIRFANRHFDEGQQQQRMVSFLQTEHSELEVTDNQIARSFREFMWYCEKPILRTAPVPLFLLSELVQEENLKVVITGEGADEVFGGYNIFREAKVRQFWARSPDSNIRFLLLKKLYPFIFSDKYNQMLRIIFRPHLTETNNPFYSHLIRWENTSKNKMYYSKDMQDLIRSYDIYEELRQHLPPDFHKWDYFDKAQYLEMKLFMSGYLLSSQGDRPAMAHSVEIRVPFLDHRLIEFMSRVPAKWKIRGLREKYILMKVFQDYLPADILNRKKQPYRAPINGNLLNGKEHEILNHRFVRKSEIFDWEEIYSFINRSQQSGHQSEVDGMLLAGIVSTFYLLQSFTSTQFFNPSPSEPDVIVDKTRRLIPS
ncbi:MAG: asparagine synthase (glutamine-hydrolyzing), partial [Calditrichota bacterium]